MKTDEWIKHCAALLSQRRDDALLRTRTAVRPIDSTHLEIDGVTYVNFAGNDYLGLSHHPRLLEAAREATATHGTGSGAAGLISGYTDAHAQAEAAIAKWKGTESAVILPSGYQANLAAVQTLAAIGASYPNGVRFLVDKLAHASIIDAVRATQAPMRSFPHNHMKKLRRLLEGAEPQQLQVVLSESIFSMDGDAADLYGLEALKRDHPFVLVLDEAHASGVVGRDGAGLAAQLNLQHIVDVSVVTLSKAVGCIGGAVCSSKTFCDALINFGRAYIYSTSVPASVQACVEAAIRVMRDEPDRRQRLSVLSQRVNAALRLGSGMMPIIPIVLGSEAAALAAAEELRRQGMLVIAVRPPTVPRRSSRLRVTLSCDHTDEDVDRLIDALKNVSASATVAKAP